MCETFSVTSALYLDMNENLPDVSLVEKLYDKLCKKTPEAARDAAFYEQEKQYLDAIEKGHNYKFIGKVGQFCPVVEGAGGGRLMRFADGKYYAATGSTGYRWLESETIRNSGNNKICWGHCAFSPEWCGNTPKYVVGENDHSLMQRLSSAGTEHRKYMRMMPVYVRITAPLYWWKEFDTYKVGTVANSCSTMHEID